MKKIISAILSLCLICSFSVIAAASSYDAQQIGIEPISHNHAADEQNTSDAPVPRAPGCPNYCGPLSSTTLREQDSNGVWGIVGIKYYCQVCGFSYIIWE